MNTLSNRNWQLINWSAVVMFTLGFWLSASLIIDLVMVPSLLAAGMMEQGEFASVGYLIFGVFNRIELVCAALVLTSFLVFKRNHTLTHLQESWSLVLAAILLVITLIYTYALTPQMSSLGLPLNLLDSTYTMPTEMISLHWGYGILEVIKLITGATLLRWCYRDSCPLA